MQLLTNYFQATNEAMMKRAEAELKDFVKTEQAFTFALELLKNVSQLDERLVWFVTFVFEKRIRREWFEEDVSLVKSLLVSAMITLDQLKKGNLLSQIVEIYCGTILVNYETVSPVTEVVTLFKNTQNSHLFFTCLSTIFDIFENKVTKVKIRLRIKANTFIQFSNEGKNIMRVILNNYHTDFTGALNCFAKAFTTFQFYVFRTIDFTKMIQQASLMPELNEVVSDCCDKMISAHGTDFPLFNLLKMLEAMRLQIANSVNNDHFNVNFIVQLMTLVVNSDRQMNDLNFKASVNDGVTSVLKFNELHHSDVKMMRELHPVFPILARYVYTIGELDKIEVMCACILDSIFHFKNGRMEELDLTEDLLNKQTEYERLIDQSMLYIGGLIEYNENCKSICENYSKNAIELILNRKTIGIGAILDFSTANSVFLMSLAGKNLSPEGCTSFLKQVLEYGVCVQSIQDDECKTLVTSYAVLVENLCGMLRASTIEMRSSIASIIFSMGFKCVNVYIKKEILELGFDVVAMWKPESLTYKVVNDIFKQILGVVGQFPAQLQAEVYGMVLSFVLIENGREISQQEVDFGNQLLNFLILQIKEKCEKNDENGCITSILFMKDVISKCDSIRVGSSLLFNCVELLHVTYVKDNLMKMSKYLRNAYCQLFNETIKTLGNNLADGQLSGVVDSFFEVYGEHFDDVIKSGDKIECESLCVYIAMFSRFVQFSVRKYVNNFDGMPIELLQMSEKAFMFCMDKLGKLLSSDLYTTEVVIESYTILFDLTEMFAEKVMTDQELVMFGVNMIVKGIKNEDMSVVRLVVERVEQLNMKKRMFKWDYIRKASTRIVFTVLTTMIENHNNFEELAKLLFDFSKEQPNAKAIFEEVLYTINTEEGVPEKERNRIVLLFQNLTPKSFLRTLKNFVNDVAINRSLVNC
ncbi:hypothetical protein EIN_376090 [Entamoeba invadens IP1]|uniref:Importin N-terminal domain-containing protein n=1 Tax=Entamoeba invadens IP1 TaxID=370355 RepID=A0A0A1TU73_ENTIV|nr:hypothetical protein EIN_376090 [Entamoeba invadens IP1]ELP83464.1 hypothetical protein EIN_376090 [Entamoeba invadens IP1]|eukprot:XP_004182810.1 hypothetical protein EIN_376090 [Entamoeba invadens IP1]